MLDDVKHLEKLALTMGFQHEDIILFDNLTDIETLEALAYGLKLNVFINFCFVLNRNYDKVSANTQLAETGEATIIFFW